MATAEQSVEPQEQQLDKGLKSGALGLISTTVIATASVAPAYSIAATLVFVVGAVALQAPGRGRARLRPDAADLDRLQRAEQGRPGLRHHVHLGHPRVRAEDRLGRRLGHRRADVLVMASLAQVASQYVFLLFDAKGIGSNADQRLGAAGRHHLDRADDRDLLRRHRGVGELPEDPARHRAHHAVRAVHRRPGQGRLRARAARAPHPEHPAGSTRSRSPASARSPAASS